MISEIIIYSVLAGLSSIFGIYLVRRSEDWTKRNVSFCISFAIGVLLADAFFYIIPEALEINPHWYYWTLGMIIFLFIVEHFIILHSCQEESYPEHTHALGTTSFLGLVFHSFIDGLIIGVGFKFHCRYFAQDRRRSFHLYFVA